MPKSNTPQKTKQNKTKQINQTNKQTNKQKLTKQTKSSKNKQTNKQTWSHESTCDCTARQSITVLLKAKEQQKIKTNKN